MNQTDIFNQLPAYLTPEQLARYLGVGITTTYRLLRRGEIKAVRVGKQYRIPVSAVQNYMCVA